MDFITQTMLGAAAGHAVVSSKLGRAALLLGAAGGALPDLDVFLSGFADPALASGLHRHFSHSLAFIPVGGLLAAAPFLLVPWFRRRWRPSLAAAAVGCATHGLLDTCTSYGTHLLWPFTDGRASWDLVSIIDPLFTLPLVLAVLIALIVGSAVPTRVIACWCLAYLTFGLVQHERAAAVQRQVATQRGHEPERGRVMPTLGNVVLWRSVYQLDGRLHADAIRVPFLGSPSVQYGVDIELFRAEDLPDAVRDDARSSHVFDRFAHFSDGYVAAVEDDPLILGDMRYSLETSGFAPLWGIRFGANPHVTVDRWNPRIPKDALDLAARWRMIREGQPGFVAVDHLGAGRD